MFERFTQESREVLARAQVEARELRHDFIGTEHILLGLKGTPAAEMLERLGASMGGLREAIVGLVGPGPGLVTGSPPFTARAKKALELSLREALARNDTAIRPEHLLLGLLREGDGVAAQVLGEAGITHDAVGAAVGPALSTSDPGRRLWRRAFRGSSNFPPSIVGNATPGAEALPITARRVAGSDPVSTYHYLVALLGEGVAGRILDSLGVTPAAVSAKLVELGTGGTSDDMPTVTVEVGGDTFAVTPRQADDLRRWLRGDAPPPVPPEA